jgi:hypothetical protein
MKQNKLFILILATFILISSVQALSVDLQDVNNERRGDGVEFDVEIILNSLEQFMLENDYLIIKKIDLILEGPEDFQETCSIHDEQDIDCNLELEVNIKNTEYEIEWDTSSKQEKGTYTSKVKAYVSDKYPQFSYCGIMEGIFREWYFTQTQGTFDPMLDLDGNGVVDLFDVLIFSSEEQYQEDSVLFGKFREHFGAIQDIQIIIDILNVYEDDVVDISDLVVFTQNMDDEAWCLTQLDIEEYVAYEYESEEKEFKLTSKQRSSPEEEEFPSWYYQGTAQEELVQDTTQKQIIETPGDAGIKILLIIGIILELIIIFYFLKKLS